MMTRVFPCSCRMFHFMRFDAFPEDWEQKDFRAEAYISISGDFRRTWKDRVKGAWHVLKGCEQHSNEVLLDRAGAVDLRNVLEEYLWEIGYEYAPFHSCTPGCTHPAPYVDQGFAETLKKRMNKIDGDL